MALVSPLATLPQLPPACGKCGDAAHLYLDEPDGDAACLVCGWRPSRAPTAAESAREDARALARTPTAVEAEGLDRRTLTGRYVR